MDITKIVQDPEWKKIEELLDGYLEEIIDIRKIDLKQSAEHVKAELIGRIEAYNSVAQFLNGSNIVSKPINPITNPFK